MRMIFAFLVLCSPAFGDTCPPPPDLEQGKSALMADLSRAANEMQARGLINELWTLWATAPDATAQGYLDEGMERRGVYDFDGAIKAFDALVAYCPDYAEGYNQRAFIHFLREDYATALLDLDRALALAPDHIAALAGKALTQMGLGQDAAGQQTLRTALAMNPWLPERHLLRPAPGTDL